MSDLNDVVELVEGEVDWMKLGLELGLHYDTLEKTDKEYGGHV